VGRRIGHVEPTTTGAGLVCLLTTWKPLVSVDGNALPADGNQISAILKQKVNHLKDPIEQGNGGNLPNE